MTGVYALFHYVLVVVNCHVVFKFAVVPTSTTGLCCQILNKLTYKSILKHLQYSYQLVWFCGLPQLVFVLSVTYRHDILQVKLVLC